MRNPVRRSRKIGLTQGGRVSNGSAQEKWSRVLSRDIWRRLSYEEIPESYWIHVENPSRDYFHPVDRDEITQVLERLPASLTKALRAVILPRLKGAKKYGTAEALINFSCIILNPFPKTLEIHWSQTPPSKSALRHYEPWGASWKETTGGWAQTWTLDDLKRYYLYHLLLHELGHLNDGASVSRRRRESYAEDFALSWARKLNVI